MAIVKAVNGPGQVTKVKKITVGRPVRVVTATAASINRLADVEYNAVSGYPLQSDATNYPDDYVPSGRSGKVDGAMLVYNSSTDDWDVTVNLEKQNINGGNY